MTPEIPFLKIRPVTEFEKNELCFWNEYGIPLDCLQTFGVYAVDQFRTNNGKLIAKITDQLIFAYAVGENCYKIYQPFSSHYKFNWIGSKPQDYVFGFNQIPMKGDLLILTGGEKDVLSLTSHGIDAICLNSETANLPQWLVSTLKSRFKNIVILYDRDQTGEEQAKKLSKEHNLPYLILPEYVDNENYGKDVSDYFKHAEPFAPPLEDHLKALITETIDKHMLSLTNQSEVLKRLLKVSDHLKDKKSKNIEYNQPIMIRGEQSILFLNASMVIQGQAGANKSHLAELIASSLIQNDLATDFFLGFKRAGSQKIAVCYVDTERNHDDQFPAALQRILLLAGYQVSDNPTDFYFTSLLDIPRSDRIKALGEYVQKIRNDISGPIVVILDVLTDCLSDFNNPKDSLELIDMLNNFSNSHGITFISLIHENPGSNNKARGHLGTELINKATTVLQVSLVNDDEEKIDGVKIDFIKCRNTREYPPFYAVFDEETISLRLASESMSKILSKSKESKAVIKDVILYLGYQVSYPISKSDLNNALKKHFLCGLRTLEDRLKKILEEQIPIETEEGLNVLIKENDGREKMFILERIQNDVLQLQNPI